MRKVQSNCSASRSDSKETHKADQVPIVSTKAYGAKHARASNEEIQVREHGFNKTIDLQNNLTGDLYHGLETEKYARMDDNRNETHSG